MSRFAPPSVREVDLEWQRLPVKARAKARWLMLVHVRNPGSDLRGRMDSLGFSPALAVWAEAECNRRRLYEANQPANEDPSDGPVIVSLAGFLLALVWLIAEVRNPAPEPRLWALGAASATSYVMWRTLLRCLNAWYRGSLRRSGGDAR
ncbi:hypothetical protein [Fimbriimonas ginsengisoli]|nr:hypothetical protein [Fimbriimonas ginsengisoli]